MSALSSAGLNRNTSLRGRRTGKYAVLLLTCAPGCKPGSPTWMPAAVTGCRFMIRRVRCLEAAAAAQAFNLSHLGSDFAGEWAVVVSSQFGVIPDQPAALLVEIQQEGQPARLMELDDPRPAFVREFNAQAKEFGCTASVEAAHA